MALQRWAREPLVHFLIGGLVLWLVLAWTGEPTDPASRSITVTEEDRARMALQWQRMMQRPPTDAELDSLTQTWLREEILYREALRLRLDRNDAVVRKRLANKMDFLATAMTEAEQPDEATLQAWLREHPQRFAEDTRYSFEQRYFADERAAQAALESGNPQETAQAISLPASVDAQAASWVERRFGLAFLGRLQDLAVSQDWRGPIASGFGWHLVRLVARDVGSVPELAAVRSAVETDWRSQTMEARRDHAYQLLRDAYDVTIE